MRELRDGRARRLGSGHEMVHPPARVQGILISMFPFPKRAIRQEISRVRLTYENTVILDGDSKTVGIYLDGGPLGRAWGSAVGLGKLRGGG